MDSSVVYGAVGELVKGTKVPTEVVNAHVTRLQANMGLTSGTVQEVSNKHLQDLATKAAGQNATTEFITRYKEAAGQNCTNLASMMEILHGVCGNETTKKHLNSKHSKHDYHSLKERLLQQVGSRAVLDGKDESFSGGDSGRRGLPFPSRKLLTNDFSSCDDDILNQQFGSLGCVPVASQENKLVQDLLFCFIGIPGVHLKPKPNRIAGKIEFELGLDIDPSLRALVLRITPLCEYYSNVVQFVEKYSQMSAGRVNQALSGAIQQVLKDYYVFVAELESQHRRGELTLNKVSVCATFRSF